MQKLYYKQSWFSSSDTTYLYVILCHTISNTTNDTGRDGQDSAVINTLKTLFSHTPNLIYMGDFNTRESDEPGYEYITQTSDTNYIMDDPPFHPDAHLTYPDIWHTGNADQAYFTTTTRETTEPNSCGTTGGAKDWYDHILLSPWIVEGVNNLKYVRNSYKTIGNNGNRAGIDVNDSTTHGYNTAAPQTVLDALYNFSDKYPVEVTLTVNPILSVANIQSNPGSIKVNNPVGDNLVMHFASFLNGQDITMAIYDVCGRNLYQSTFNISSSTVNKNISLAPGVYFVRFNAGGYSNTIKVVKD
jgi:Secretion system C-terminal sorting domain